MRKLKNAVKSREVEGLRVVSQIAWEVELLDGEDELIARRGLRMDVDRLDAPTRSTLEDLALILIEKDRLDREAQIAAAKRTRAHEAEVHRTLGGRAAAEPSAPGS